MMRRLLRQMTCHLPAHILASTMVAGKTRQCSFYPKHSNFLAISTQKTSQTPSKHIQINSPTQRIQNKVQKPEIKLS
jgi:hypothetical protein